MRSSDGVGAEVLRQGVTEVRLRNSESSGDRNLLANPNEISPNNYSK